MKNSENGSSKSVNLTLVSILGLAFFLFATVLIAYVVNFSGELTNKQEAWGWFGDYIGGTLNPIFAFLALIALLYTIHVQSKALKETQDTLISQNDLLKEQKIDNRFFQLLEFYTKTVSDLEVTDKNDSMKVHKGRYCFQYWVTHMGNKIDSYSNNPGPSNGDYFNKDYRQALIKKSYGYFYIDYQVNLGLYFRNLYHIYKYIDESNAPDKLFYTRIVRAQLSAFEVSLVFYNGLSEYGEKFKPLIEKYQVLNNINPAYLSVKFEGLYEDSAYNIAN